MKMATLLEAFPIEPYVGPVPFEAKDQALFFGRESESDELLSLAIAHPVVVMYAQSGAGKTSLLNADFIPKLRKEGYEVLPTARVQGNDCDARTNIYVFNALMSWSDGKIEPQRLGKMRLVDFLQAREHQTDKVDWEVPRFLIFDQFEELFTAYPQRWQERKEFFVQLRHALEQDYLLRVVFAMREDYIAELDAYASSLPEKLRTRFRLERPRAKAALAAVRKPLTIIKTTRRFADGVAEKLVENLMMIPADDDDGEPRIGQSIEPVQLQVVCQSLWRALQPEDEIITFQHLEHCGDVNRALADFYERCLAQTVKGTGVREGELREWFGTVLITMDGTRGMVFRGPERTGEIPNSAVDVLQKLHVIKEERRGRSRWYELAHDRFIDPIRKSNEKWWGVRAGALETRQRLEARAREWARRGRGTDGLLDEAELLEADRWLKGPDAADLRPSETVLALTSASRAEIRERAEAIRQAQMLAVEQSRRLRQQRFGLVALIVLLIAMSGITAFAYQQGKAAKAAEVVANHLKEEALRSKDFAEVARNEAIIRKSEAQFQRDVAEEARKEAIKQKQLAELAGGEANKQKLEAQKQREQAVAQAVAARKAEANAMAQRELATNALAEVQKQKNIRKSHDLSLAAKSQLAADPELSVLLAREAVSKTLDLDPTETREATELLHAGLNALRKRDSYALTVNQVRGATFSPDGSRLAVLISRTGPNIGQKPGPRITTIETWEKDFSKPLRELLGGKTLTLPMTFSSDGKFLVSASSDRSLLLWNVDTGELLDQTSETANLYLTNLAFSSTNLLVACGWRAERSGQAIIRENEALLWNLTRLKFAPATEVYKDDDYRNPIAVAFSADGNTLALGRSGGTIIFKDSTTFQPIEKDTRIQLEKSAVTWSVAFSSNGKRFAAASTDGVLKVWEFAKKSDFAHATELFRLCGTPEETPLAFSPDLEYVATTGVGFSAKVRRLGKRNSLEEVATLEKPDELSLVGQKGSLLRGAFSGDGKSLITASSDGTAFVWEISSSGHELAVFSGAWSEVGGIAFSPNGTRLVGAIADARWASANVWADNSETWREDTASQVPLLKLAHKGKSKVWAVAYSRDGSRIATAGEDRTTRIWDASTGELKQTLPRKEREVDGHKGTVREVSFSRDGTLLATSSDDGKAKIWDVISGKLLKTLSDHDGEGHEGEVWGVAFSPDGKRVATAGHDRTARIWDIESGQELFTLRGHSDSIWKVTFSPDGTRVATASHDGTAKVWDAATGKELITLATGNRYQLWGVSFSPDGSRIATASSDRTARIWDATTGRELLVLTGHSGTVNRVVFSPDGKRLATSSEDGTVRFYALDINLLVELSKQRVPRDWTPEERKMYLPGP